MEKQKYTKGQHKKLIAIFEEKDDVKRWSLIHDLVREVNPKAKREQDKQAKAMSEVRNAKLYNNKKNLGAAGLKFSVSIPNVTYQALVELDQAVTGKSKLREPEKNRFKSRSATNVISRNLSKALPEYKAS